VGVADLDEVSRAIGKLEGEFRAFRDAQARHYEDAKLYQSTVSDKLEKIERYIEYHKGKTAMLAAAISLVFTLVVGIAKDWFRRL
jgi:hypothetical protein